MKNNIIFISTFLFSFYLFVQFSIPAKRFYAGIKTSGAMEAMHFWNNSRSYPNCTLPNIGLTREFDLAKKSLNKISTPDRWQQIGPHNIGGRTISLAINPLNPKTIYAGSASGGLWRSYTAGEGSRAWEYVSTEFPVLGVGAIAFAPNDSNEIFIGTGEIYNYDNTLGGVTIRETRGSYGIGILKTTDAGLTWEKSLDWSYEQQRGVMVIRVNPLNSNTVWAGTSEGTYKSTDTGQSWNKVHSVIMTTDLIINPVDTNTIIIACGNLGSSGHGIYRTTNSGDNWEKLITGLPSSYGGKAQLCAYQSDPGIIYASIGNGYWSNAGTWLCKTTNGGDTWQVISTLDYSTYQGWFAHFVVVHQNDPNKILTAGVDVFKSTNGGQSLTQKSYWYNWDFGRPPVGGPEGPSDYSHADHHAYVIHPHDPNIIYFGNDGGVFRTTDFGETFQGQNGGYQTTQFYNGFSTSMTDSLLAIGGMQDNSTAIYDGSPAWIRQIGGDGGWASVNQTNNNVLFGSWQYLHIVKLTKQNPNFYSENYIDPPRQGSIGFIAPFVVSVENPNVIYAGSSIVYKSTNSGLNWSATNNSIPVSSDPPVSMEISLFNSNIVYVGTAPINDRARLFKTTNGGSSWEDITRSLPDRYPMDIALDWNDDQMVYVALSGFGTSHLYKSVNGGDDWEDVGTGLPDVPTSAVVVDPDFPEHIYAGNDLGVFVTLNNGETWNGFNEGLPDAVMVSNISISYSDRSLKIGTHGNGAFERRLIGNTTDIDDEIHVPSSIKLYQNFPNPFNPTTLISYRVVDAFNASTTMITVKIYDILGREITTLVNESKPPGTYEVEFNAASLPSGIYIYTLQSGSFSTSKKMVLLR